MANKRSVKLYDFKDLNLVMKPTDPTRVYNEDEASTLKNIHWGQRKLILSEIQFFTLYVKTDGIKDVVYAGSAPGYHIPFLSDIFPELTFHCYDPRKFGILPTDKIHIYSGREENLGIKEDGGDSRYNVVDGKQEDGFFTVEKAQRHKGAFLISDIRRFGFNSVFRDELNKAGVKYTAVGSDYYINNDGLSEDDADNNTASYRAVRKLAGELENKYVEEDMQMQQDWVIAMDAEKALLKFRVPYAIKNQTSKYRYLAGNVFYQCWPRKGSSETRLVPVRNKDGQYYEDDYDTLQYEELCYYHNYIRRAKHFYKNIFTHDNRRLDGSELVNDYDSTAEAVILRDYWISRGVHGENLEKLTIALSQTISNFLYKLNNKQVTLQSRRKKAQLYIPNFQQVNKGAIGSVLDKEGDLGNIKKNLQKSEPFHSNKKLFDTDVRKKNIDVDISMLNNNQSTLFNIEYDRYQTILMIENDLTKFYDNPEIITYLQQCVLQCIVTNNNTHIDEFFGDFVSFETSSSSYVDNNDDNTFVVSIRKLIDNLNTLSEEYNWDTLVKTSVDKHISAYLDRRQNNQCFKAPSVKAIPQINDYIIECGDNKISIRDKIFDKLLAKVDNNYELLAILIYRYEYIDTQIKSLPKFFLDKLSKYSKLGIVEIFTNPLSANTDIYYSFFNDIDKKFGSQGIFDFKFDKNVMYIFNMIPSFSENIRTNFKQGGLLLFTSDVNFGIDFESKIVKEVTSDQYTLSYQGTTVLAKSPMLLILLSDNKNLLNFDIVRSFKIPEKLRT